MNLMRVLGDVTGIDSRHDLLAQQLRRDPALFVHDPARSLLDEHGAPYEAAQDASG